jgi:hypothetical protein
MARYARYAAAVIFAFLALALVALWVRSYTIRDTLWWLTTTRGIELSSLSGHVVIISTKPDKFGADGPFKTFHETINPNRTLSFKRNVLRFLYHRQPNLTRFDAPYWFVVLTCVVLSAASLKKDLKFSLRTLLFATTVVAAVLGLAVYAAS